MNIYLKEDSIEDKKRIYEYNQEYMRVYPDFIPFMTEENFEEVLKDVQDKKLGINNNGIKEIFYFAIENDKIIGFGSIRLNPEIDNNVLLESGHITYGVIPCKRKKGYGSYICRLLLNKAKELGLNSVIITCNENNTGSAKIIEKNNGEYIETININDIKTKRYLVSL